jgi:hypothetical protein
MGLDFSVGEGLESKGQGQELHHGGRTGMGPR